MSRSKFVVGSKVKYSAKWLKSTGQYTGAICFAIGIITELQTVGARLTLARIDWDCPDIPERVNIANLTLKGRPEYLE